MYNFLRSTAVIVIAACTVPDVSAATLNINAETARNISDYHEESDGMGGFIEVFDGDGDQVVGVSG